MIQKYLNFHYSRVAGPLRRRDLDQRGQLLHRRAEGPLDRRSAADDDHRLTDDSIEVDAVVDGEIGRTEVSALVGLNTDLRREYIADCQNGVNRWNRILDGAGLPQRLRLPHVGVQPEGRRVRRHRGDAGRRAAQRRGVGAGARASGCRPSVDKTHVRSLMRPVYERGKIAAWIAPPRQGINGKPFDYDYVHLA